MWTLLGVPCLTVPAVWGDSGLPTGVQLVGRVGDDARLIAAGVFLDTGLPAPPRAAAAPRFCSSPVGSAAAARSTRTRRWRARSIRASPPDRESASVTT